MSRAFQVQRVACTHGTHLSQMRTTLPDRMVTPVRRRPTCTGGGQAPVSPGGSESDQAAKRGDGMRRIRHVLKVCMMQHRGAATGCLSRRAAALAWHAAPCWQWSPCMHPVSEELYCAFQPARASSSAHKCGGSRARGVKLARGATKCPTSTHAVQPESC